MGYGPISGGSAVDIESIIGSGENGQAVYLMTAHLNSNGNFYLLASNNGLKWNFIRSQAIAPYRDPSIAYINGQYCVCVTADPGGTNQFKVLTSKDLSNWNEIGSVDMSAAGDFAWVWAPEWFIDTDGSVHVLVAASVGDRDHFHLYELHPTNSDLTQWSEPVQITGTDIPSNMIDPFMVKIGTTYHLWYKNETTKYIEVMASTSLTSGYTVEHSGDWAGWGSGVEGMSLVKNGNAWRIYMDKYTAQGIFYSESSDDWATWTPKQLIQTPVTVSHPTVIQTNSVSIARNVFASYIQDGSSQYISTSSEDEVAFIDSFNDSSIWWGWKVIQGNGTITEANGKLNITIPQGKTTSWWSDSTTAPRIGLPVAKDLCIAQVKIDSINFDVGSAVGMFISQTMDSTALKTWTLLITRQDSINNGIFAQQVGGSGNTVGTQSVAYGVPVWLRIKISGVGTLNKTIFEYSLDQITWSTIYLAEPLPNFDASSPIMVGLCATSWQAVAVNVDFKDFKLIRPLGPR